MLQYNFKDKYYNQNGEDIERYYNTTFYSPTITGGKGTRLSPYRSNASLVGLTASGNQALILSSGNHGVSSSSMTHTFTKCINGHGIGKTIWSPAIYIPSGTTRTDVLFFRDITFGSSLISATAPNNAYRVNTYLYQCEISTDFRFVQSGYAGFPVSINRCKNRAIPTATLGTNSTSVNYSNNNAFIGINSTIGSIAGSLHTFEKCNLIVNQASLDTYKSNYYAFDNCNFRIGTETDYTPLTGTSAEELRDDFVARSTAAGLTMPPDITDYDMTLTLGRWIFTKNQIFEGLTWKGSEINLFEIPRFKLFGYSTSRGDKIAITTEKNVPASFAPNNSDSLGLDFASDSLSINSGIDITQKYNLYTDSKIIWLGGNMKLTSIDIPNDLPYQYGVLIDSIPGLLCDAGQEVAVIEPNEFYYVRSKNVNEASVKYNNVIYSSALSTRNNILKGVANFTSFSANTGEPVVYKINDVLNYNSIQLRIVNKIPEAEITSGSLQADYWYYVDYKNSNNVSGAIVYNGVSYGATDSFLAKSGISTYTAHSNLKLRRCWHKDFEFKTGIADEVFWQNEQKPLWIDVLPEDTRCLMLNNSEKTQEMQSSSGVYIASGHPDFYNSILGSSSIPVPAFPIKGAFMQIRIPITTINPV
ncbi:conserved hypothetical protein [uncultured Dysgonomonas sp.]|uniref:Uncharacterized protein n=2 Tax=uncultured Dysgonomonas sp. TaxID=206096 RepID=A0A212K689_9BACT|nr:conserved hypothetical protein [uncultured Dysgonomonas sp.]